MAQIMFTEHLIVCSLATNPLIACLVEMWIFGTSITFQFEITISVVDVKLIGVETFIPSS